MDSVIATRISTRGIWVVLVKKHTVDFTDVNKALNQSMILAEHLHVEVGVTTNEKVDLTFCQMLFEFGHPYMTGVIQLHMVIIEK